MKRIYVLFSSLLFLLSTLSATDEDTLKVKRVFIFGAEVTGPIISTINSDNQNYEGYLAYRLNRKYYIVAEAGYGKFNYEQYNYMYNNSGIFVRVGTDINLLKPEISSGNNYAGIGLRYGLSLMNQETPWFKYDNYWGTTESSIPGQGVTGHYFQLSGGIKAELFTNIVVGWTIRMNLLIYQSAGKENKPVYIPGMGGTDGGIQPGISFHIAWILPLE